MSKGMYKFIPLTEWEAVEEITNDDGNVTTRRTCPDYYANQNARIGTGEVIISCNDGCGTHTWEEALANIEANWSVEDGV